MLNVTAPSWSFKLLAMRTQEKDGRNWKAMACVRFHQRGCHPYSMLFHREDAAISIDTSRKLGFTVISDCPWSSLQWHDKAKHSNWLVFYPQIVKLVPTPCCPWSSLYSSEDSDEANHSNCLLSTKFVKLGRTSCCSWSNFYPSDDMTKQTF